MGLKNIRNNVIYVYRIHMFQCIYYLNGPHLFSEWISVSAVFSMHMCVCASVGMGV